MDSSLSVGAGVHTLDFPPEYFPSDGYADLHDPLHAKVLLFRQEKVSGAIATLELPSVRPWELTDELRGFCAQLLSVPYDHLWLVMTHNLSAPHVPTDSNKRVLHMTVLRQALGLACAQALECLQPVSVALHQGQCRINVNRNVESVDGWWVGINPRRDSDPTLTALVFSKRDGSPAAVLYSYAIKSSVLENVTMSNGEHYASADVTGAAGVKAEARLGCPVLFLMSAAGDQVPCKKGNYLELDSRGHFQAINLAEQSWQILDFLSNMLCDSLCQTVNCSSARPLNGKLRFAQVTFPCPGQVSYPRNLPEPPVQHYHYLKSADELLTLWGICVGECALLGVKSEVTTPTFRALQSESPFPETLLATLVNGGQGYIATDFDYDNFTYPGLKSPFYRGTDRIFLEKSKSFLRALHPED